MEVECSSETLLAIYKTTRCNNPEDQSLKDIGA
jgi:hypothetical protein